MLDILKNNNLCNVLVVITRYFGGILLGTGGLVRAYSECTKKAIENSEKVCKCKGYKIEIELDYTNLENFKYYCSKTNIQITEIEYLDVIVCKIELEKKTKPNFINDIETKKININKIRNLCEKIINKSVEK